MRHYVLSKCLICVWRVIRASDTPVQKLVLDFRPLTFSCKLLAWLWRLHLHICGQTVKRACGKLFNCWSSHIYIPYVVVLLISYIDCTWHWMHALITFKTYEVPDGKMFIELELNLNYLEKYVYGGSIIFFHPCAQWTAYKLFSGLINLFVISSLSGDWASREFGISIFAQRTLEGRRLLHRHLLSKQTRGQS